jgi:hypothetical protein
MNYKCLFPALVFLLSSSASFSLIADQTSEWVSIKLSQQRDGEKQYRGFMLYTTGAEKTGVAFRCENGQLHTFVAVKPVDFRKILQQRPSKVRNREISFSIDDGAKIVEDWVQMFSGQIYLVRKISTGRDIFKAATLGATISFTRKYGKPATISLPVLDQPVFGPFLESCELKAKYSPQLKLGSG